ncbi:DEAD/DEAH box helicase [Thiothrix unzii]|uniref:DEAD/DEAH box helicase n=1 Tax=Thiothrix unzii TaxID=111769 RepID=UPI002A35B46A|nr:DEAD/DEAH box helicase [Thiothrix unzii]MDX9988830.1 DEAD/DEAH box helicase [Thiothrix unzii]
MHLLPKYIDLLADNNIPQSVLFTVFDTATVERGIDYFEANHVTHYRAEPSGNGNVMIYAKVQGNSRTPYATTVSYNEKRPHWITGMCSCPVTTSCKHSVAVLFSYLEQVSKLKRRESELRGLGARAFTAASLPTARGKQVSPIDFWLQSITAASRSSQEVNTSVEVVTPQAQLLYLLRFDNYRTELVNIGIYRSSPLKKGGLGKPSSIPLDTLITNHRARNFHYEPHDLMIAQLLALPELRFASYGHSGILTGRVGQQVLTEVLKTGRAFWATAEAWQHAAQPLRSGMRRLFDFQWTTDEKGCYHVGLVAEKPIDQRFWLNGELWFVDSANRECGLLEYPDLNSQQVEKLLNAPPIPPEEAEVVSERLLEILPDADIPAPSVKVRQEMEALEYPLQPVILLQTLLSDEHGRALHGVSLSFRYDTHVLRPTTPGASSVVKVDKQRYRLQRDRLGEQSALEALSDYGFESGRKRFSSLHPLDFVLEADNKTLGALRWHDFLEHGLSSLQHAGWQVEIAEDFDLKFDVVDEFDAAWEESAGSNDWFEISMGFQVDGQRVNLLPILVEMLTQMESPQALQELLRRQEHLLVPLSDNRWVKLDAKRLEGIMETLVELYDHQPLNADGNLEFSRFQGANLAALLNAPGMKWKGTEELAELTEKLRNFQGIQPATIPASLQADLRPYQHEGVSWLQFLREFQFNGTLADDMGLGKTLQTLTHLLLEKEAGRMDLPSLVVAPTSLMGNWRREAARFTPGLRVQVVHGADRLRHFSSFADFDLILTTYPLMLRDEERYQKQQFHYLILDEAQAIKNAASKTTQIIYTLKARHRLCLTGTPLENHLGELWSMYHFLMPGFLGTNEKFTRLFRSPIEKQGDLGRQQQLRNRVLPFMLRRTKELVASELPPKTEIIRSVPLDGKQRDLYETVRLAMDAKVREEISKKGFARSQIMILEALLKLRQVCCDPRLVKLEKAQKVKESAKLELLMSLLPEMVEEGRKILLFSQFTSMLALIELELEKANISYCKLTGQTKNRDDVVTAFQEGDAKVFLISLKAGGTGLNLTAADTVIHYDPWWNPAVEQQATDRAYRIGQDKPVFVYKLLTEETVEEKILKLQERKQALADGLYSDKAGEEGARFSADDLMDLLKPLEK